MCAAKLHCEVDEERERRITQIERTAAELRQSGAAEAWFEGADANVRTVAAEVNGPLLELLAQGCGHNDLESVQLFRLGAPLVGVLPCTGNGSKLDEPDVDDVNDDLAEMLDNREHVNRAILSARRVDENAAELLSIAKKEEELGRMSAMSFFSRKELEEEFDTSDVTISPRFSVVQGELRQHCPNVSVFALHPV